MPSATWSGTGLGLFAPSGVVGLVIGPNGTMGRGKFTDTDLMIHDSVTLTSATRLRGWNLVGLFAAGSGGITGIEISVGDQPTSNSTNEIIGFNLVAVRAASANANGSVVGIRAQQGSYTGASATRGAVRLFDARSLTSYINQTVPSLAFYDITQVPLAGGTISGAVVGFRQGTAFGLGTPRRGVQVINSIECTANHLMTTTFGKAYVAKDNQGTPHFWGFNVLTDGTPQIVDLGTTVSNT
jgi:hypothetical protein